MLINAFLRKIDLDENGLLLCRQERRVGVQSQGGRLSGVTSGRGNSSVKGRELKARRKQRGSGAVLVTEYTGTWSSRRPGFKFQI